MPIQGGKRPSPRKDRRTEQKVKEKRHNNQKKIYKNKVTIPRKKPRGAKAKGSIVFTRKTESTEKERAVSSS